MAVTMRAPDSDPLLGGLPDLVRVHATHMETVLELPVDAVRLAHGDLDQNHAFRVGESAWGVQFHPEFDADVMRRYLRLRRELVAAEGLDPDRLLAEVSETACGPQILARFAVLARNRRRSGRARTPFGRSWE